MVEVFKFEYIKLGDDEPTVQEKPDGTAKVQCRNVNIFFCASSGTFFCFVVVVFVNKLLLLTKFKS